MDSKKKDLVISKLEESRGVVTIACKNAGVSRSAFYEWLKDDADFAARVEDAREQAVDYVEGKLFDLIDGKDTTATIFFLKTRGKSRGYVERQEVTGADSQPLKIQIDFKNATIEQLRELSKDDTGRD